MFKFPASGFKTILKNGLGTTLDQRHLMEDGVSAFARKKIKIKIKKFLDY